MAPNAYQHLQIIYGHENGKNSFENSLTRKNFHLALEGKAQTHIVCVIYYFDFQIYLAELTNLVSGIDQINMGESTKKLTKVTMLGEIVAGRSGSWPKCSG